MVGVLQATCLGGDFQECCFYFSKSRIEATATRRLVGGGRVGDRRRRPSGERDSCLIYSFLSKHSPQGPPSCLTDFLDPAAPNELLVSDILVSSGEDACC